MRVILILPSHFWLDETATFWNTGGGLAQLVARCTQFPLSILYGVLILALRSLGARAEWAFRLPSVVAVAIAAYVLFRMARSLWGNTAAWLSLAMFVSLPGVSSAARSARPYGFGLLFVVLATWLLWKLLEKASFASALRYGATAGLTVPLPLAFRVGRDGSRPVLRLPALARAEDSHQIRRDHGGHHRSRGVAASTDRVCRQQGLGTP